MVVPATVLGGVKVAVVEPVPDAFDHGPPLEAEDCH
jgi:hypothetical protein